MVRRATGLTVNEVEEQHQAARDREERASAGPGEPRKPSELDIASCQRLEWARIEQVMTKQHMSVYSPDEDRRVARREELRAQRKAIEAARSEQSGGGLPVEVLRHRVYRITARAVSALMEEEAVVRHVFAASAGAAVEHAHRMFGQPGGAYRDSEYRIDSVEQVLPEPGKIF